MATFITDLRERFRRGNLCLQLIYVNVAVFVVVALVGIVLQLFNLPSSDLMRGLALPADPARFIRQPWSILTYMFMHDGLLHIFFNMLGLYWFGLFFLQLFSAKHLRGLYLLGGICGGLLYMLAFNVFPYFRPQVGGAFMVGASASVLAVAIAVACREPNCPVRLFLLGTIRLKWLALIYVLLDLLMITTDNAGGHIAHLGGALAGFWFAASLAKGHDITAWINRACDFCLSPFDPRRKPRRPKMKVHYNPKREADYEYNARRKAQSDEIDRILDKLKQSGYGSLTAEEKKKLFDASRRN